MHLMFLIQRDQKLNPSSEDQSISKMNISKIQVFY